MWKRAKSVEVFLQEMNNEKRKMDSTEDMISKLPDEIIVTILSFLPTKQALRTTILARRWRNLWKYTTTLDIESDKRIHLRRICGNSIVDAAGIFSVDWVNRTLDSHRAPNCKFLRIRLHSCDIQSDTDINRWLEFAVNKSVQNLDLVLLAPPPISLVPSPFGYYFPCLQFSDFKSLKNLSLQIKKVDCTHVECFLSHCPALEELRLSDSDSVKNLKISSESLKKLEILGCCNLENLDLLAVNLVSFKYRGPDIKFAFNNVPLLVEVSFVGTYCLSLVKHEFKQFFPVLFQLETLKLSLNYPWFTKFPQVDELQNIKQLELNLRVWDYGKAFHLCASLIEALPLLYKFSLHLFWPVNSEFKDGYKPFVENHRHHCLRVLELVGFIGCTCDKEIVKYLVNTAVSLEKVSFRVCREACIDTPVDFIEMEEKETAKQSAYEFRAMLCPYTQFVVL